MDLLKGDRIRLVVVGIVAAIVLGGNVKADFTFGEPINLGHIVNDSSYDDKPCISADGLSLYFTSDREGGYGFEDIWLCTRQTIDDPWRPAENLGTVINSGLGEFHVSVSTDELELYFERWDFGTGTNMYIFDIWVAKRTEKDAAWGQPVKLDLVIPDGFMAGSPSLSGDGLELYFGVYKFGDEPQSQLYLAKRESRDGLWTEPVSLGSVVNSWNCQAMPMISRDGLFLTFNDWYAGPSRPGGFGDQDIWFTRRAIKDNDWEPPVNIGLNINSTFKDRGGQISADGSTLYFSSNRPGGHGSYDLWQAPILPIVDFDGDGNIDTSDMVMLIDGWGTNDTLYDIGPMPWGDGVVDVEDLKVFIEHWEQENML